MGHALTEADRRKATRARAEAERAKAGRGAITVLNLGLLNLDAAKAKATAAGWQREAGQLDRYARELTALLGKMRERAEAAESARDALS